MYMGILWPYAGRRYRAISGAAALLPEEVCLASYAVHVVSGLNSRALPSLRSAGAMDRVSQRKKPSGGLRAVPPPYFCFTVPRFHLLPAMEALLGLLFANLFWVGLWDLLDTTIFPFDSSLAMLALVRMPAESWSASTRSVPALPRSPHPQVVLGTVGMYFTNALYDPVPERATPGAATEPSYGATGGVGSEATQTSAPGEQAVGRGVDGAGRAKYVGLVSLLQHCAESRLSG